MKNGYNPIEGIGCTWPCALTQLIRFLVLMAVPLSAFQLANGLFNESPKLIRLIIERDSKPTEQMTQ